MISRCSYALATASVSHHPFKLHALARTGTFSDDFIIYFAYNDFIFSGTNNKCLRYIFISLAIDGVNVRLCIG